MNTYDYHDAVKSDIMGWLAENGERYTDANGTIETQRDAVYDELFVADSVTGNGSGSYTFSTYKAEENLCHNLDLLGEALAEFGDDHFGAYLENHGAEGCDVSIRCYLLGRLLDECLTAYNEQHEHDEAEG